MRWAIPQGAAIPLQQFIEFNVLTMVPKRKEVERSDVRNFERITYIVHATIDSMHVPNTETL